MEQALRQQQTQRLQQTLAPMQLQFVRLLEMNGAEVEDEVRRAIDDNPALEPADDAEPQSDENFNESAEQLQMADYGHEDDIPSYRLETSNRSADDQRYEPVAVGGGESLYEYLMRQLKEEDMLSDRQLEIASYVVGNIDDNGYMERTMRSLVDDIAIETSVDVAEDEVRFVWDQVRALEPAGVGAMDLRDSLLLQLRRRQVTPAVELATEIVRDYFDLFSLMHFDRIAALIGVDMDRMKEAMDVIRTLHPKPGALISGDEDERMRQISPDFYVESDGDRLSLTLLGFIPRLQIERSFAPDTRIAEKDASVAASAANAFIKQKRDEASAFIKAIELRQATLFRIMSAIVQWQRDFFMTGDTLRLRPMVLKDISAITADDLSVVSRATAGKYVATPFGVYSIKSLFNERRKDNDDTSTQIVLDRIRTIIEAEDKRHPLSDSAITDLLVGEGFDIARRTVAKYREKLGLPVGRLRRMI